MVTVAATQDSQAHNSTTVVCIVAVIAAVIYLFGYLRAVMHRANSDYKKTKAILPEMRKDFWRAWWAALKVGAFVLLIVIVLGAWVRRDIKNADDVSPQPSKGVPAKVVPKGR